MWEIIAAALLGCLPRHHALCKTSKQLAYFVSQYPHHLLCISFDKDPERAYL